MRQSHRYPLASLALLVGLWLGAPARGAEVVRLSSPVWSIEIAPDTLAVTATPAGGARVELSAPQEGLGPTGPITQTAEGASWELRAKGCTVRAQLDGGALTLSFRSAGKGDITWPVVGRERAIRAYVLPLDEGSYVPVDHAEWLAALTQASPMSTTEGLSMPFWGLDLGDHTISYILTNQFHNELSFSGEGGRIIARVTHEFTREQAEEYGVVVQVGAPSPVEPARQYRRWLMARGEFVSLQDKIRQTPEAAKLLGAAHAYVWGNALLSRHDVKQWRHFAQALLRQGTATRPSPGRRLWSLLPAEARQAATEIATQGRTYPALTRVVADAISEVLARRDFFEASVWQGVQVPPEARESLSAGVAGLPTARLLRLNALLLAAAFPGEFEPVDRWGDGVSVKMMEQLAAAGLDRLWLGLDSWQGAYRHPEAIRKAKEMGYLIGTYDGYDSIHSPDEVDTWETAQFDLHLYQTGAVMGRNGKPKRGFQGKGYKLSALAARPYVTERVTRLMRELPEALNSWFMDCDAYGDLEDDYSPLHPGTQEDDMRARLERMRWIRDTYGLVIGSERGAAYAAPVIHFAHGMMTPVIGWGDPDLQKNKQSPYYLGTYWPPEAPQIMMKQVPLKPAYRTRYFDPRFRLPLYQTVFNDSVIATHHWQYASLKFLDEVGTNELLELLYNVPPLYHLNLDEFGKHKARIAAHFRFFSPLHKELTLLPMTDFAWLTPDRLVQRTVFGDRVEMVANFGARAFVYEGHSIAARSVLARWREGGRVEGYTPGG